MLDEYPLRFHPLEMGEAALEALAIRDKG